jgi:hypothetical protein
MEKCLKTGNGSGFLTGNQLFFSKFSRLHALCGKKLRNFATGNGNGVQKCLKTMFFEKKTRFLAKSLKFTRLFHPQTGNTRLLLRFYVTTFSILKQKKQIFFFFRSKNPDNLRGFCPPNRK